MSLSKAFFYAKNLDDVLYQRNTIPDLKIVGGCTSFAGKELPQKVLTIRDIPELKNIIKHERYITFGAGVTLSEIEDLGKANLPATLYDAIITISKPNIRNIATLGGNICQKRPMGSLFASLLALDAKLDFQVEDEVMSTLITRLNSIPDRSLLTKIRIPLEEWELAIFRRVGPNNKLTSLSASFVFLANSQKNQISNLRIAWTGTFSFRDMELENKLIGAHLPLSQTTISTFLLEAEGAFNAALPSNSHPIFKKQFWNLVKYSLEQLT